MVDTALCPRRAANSAERFDVRDDRLLTPGQTCWRVERADQSACVIGGPTVGGFGRCIDYFRRIDGRWRVVPDTTIPGDDPGNFGGRVATAQTRAMTD